MGMNIRLPPKKRLTLQLLHEQRLLPWDWAGSNLCVPVTGGGHERGDAVLVGNRYVRTLLEQQVDHTHIAGGACLDTTDVADVSCSQFGKQLRWKN